ncbi:MAG: CPBP family intramembrane metalloprotease [Candidatus Moranbacteria bacterium]|nr:CPBP family intramembrane metalloprotease [Candidatus Moranbacteria bacterium]
MEQWFHKEASFKESVFLIIVMLAAAYWYIFCIGTAFPGLADHLSKTPIGITIAAPSTPLFILVAAFFEELIFRFPLSIPVRRGLSVPVIMIFVAVFSIIFGLLHGTWANIFMQGVVGALFSVVYLKCGGMSGNYPKALAASTVIHFLYNMIALGLAYIAGATAI